MARVIDRVASDRPLPGGDAVVMPMPRRPTQMARTCIIARSRAALLRPACAIERAAVGAVDDGARADRKSVVEGKKVSVRADLGGRRSMQKKKKVRKIPSL